MQKYVKEQERMFHCLKNMLHILKTLCFNNLQWRILAC